MTGSEILFGPLIEMLYPFVRSRFMHVVKNCENYVLCAMCFIILACSYSTYFYDVNEFIVRFFCEKWMLVASVVVTCLTCLLLYLDCKKNKSSDYRLCKALLILLMVAGSGALYLSVYSPTILFCLVVLMVAYYAYIKVIKNKCSAEKMVPQADMLYRARLFNRTHLQIRKLAYRGKKGLTIGICGQWGSGKSFFIDTLKEKLSGALQSNEENLYCGRFSICPKVELWEASSLDDAWQRVVSALFYGVFGSYPVKCEKYTKFTVSLLSIFSSRFSILNEIIELVRPDYTERNLQAVKERMGDRKMVLIFDDLERADFKIMQAMLPLFERLKELPNLTVICAVAENEIKHVFRSNKMPIDFAQGHLNKLFDLRIEIPELPYAAIENFQNQLFCNKYDDCKLVKTFLQEYPLKFDSARQMIRVLEKLTSIERQYYSTCPYDFSLKGLAEELQQPLLSIKYVFLIEALRLTNPEVLNVLNKELHLEAFFKDIPFTVLSSSVSSITDDSWDWGIARALPQHDGYQESARQNENEFKRNHSYIYRIIMRRGIENSILFHLKTDFTSPEYRDVTFVKLFEDAYLARYVRCTTLTVWEQEYLIRNSEYSNISYSRRSSLFFKRNDEVIENSYQKEAAFSLLKYHLNEVLQSLEYLKNSYVHKDETAPVDSTSPNSLLDEVIHSLEQEVKDEEKKFLRNYAKLDAQYFINLLEVCWKSREGVAASAWEKIEKILSLLFELMPIGEKARHLAYYFELESKNSEAECNSNCNPQIAKSDVYSHLVVCFCKLYGSHLARHIYECPDSNLSEKSHYTFACQVYREIAKDIPKGAIREGISEFLSQISHISIFIEHWVAFMGHQYRSASIRGGMDSSFANAVVYELMEYIESKLKNSFDDIANLPNKEAIRKACAKSIARLQKDYNQWQDDTDTSRKEMYSSGIAKLISLISKIQKYAA